MKIKKHISSLLFLVSVFSLLILFIVLPKESYSSSEKRVLGEFPKFSLASIADGSYGTGLENYLSDHFPFRNFFVGVNSYFELLTGRNGTDGIYFGKDGYLISEPVSFDKKTIENNASRFSDFAETAGIKATLMIVPSTGYIMEDKLPKNHGEYKDDLVFDTAISNLHDIDFIDLRDAFKENSQDMQLYYKTDHHLTSAGAYLMYTQFCDKNGFTAASDFEKTSVPGFFGTTYSRSGLWYSKPDDIELWEDKNLKVKVEISDEGDTRESQSVFYNSHLEEDDKYPVFLDGNHSLVKITNENSKSDEKIVIIKDSFAHCFTTFLCENYREVYMVDLRYYRNSVSKLIEENNIGEILFLYGADNFATDTNSAWLM